MRKHMISVALAAGAALGATPALAAEGGPFFSLHNPILIIVIGFLLFVGILVYFGVPGMIGRLLDKRADQIRADLDEARALREEAQTILASYERKQKEVQAQAERIVTTAKAEAEAAAAQARADLDASIVRRLAAAEDQIASAEKSAVREVRDRAVAVAVAAAGAVLKKQMTQQSAEALIDQSIAEVEKRLH